MVMKEICKYLGIAILVLGLIGSVILGIGAGFAWFIVGCLSAIILPVILIAISEMLENLKEINDKIVNIRPSINESKENQVHIRPSMNENKEKQVQDSEDLWWCPKCGRMNSYTKESCTCGQRRC